MNLHRAAMASLLPPLSSSSSSILLPPPPPRRPCPRWRCFEQVVYRFASPCRAHPRGRAPEAHEWPGQATPALGRYVALALGTANGRILGLDPPRPGCLGRTARGRSQSRPHRWDQSRRGRRIALRRRCWGDAARSGAQFFSRARPPPPSPPLSLSLRPPFPLCFAHVGHWCARHCMTACSCPASPLSLFPPSPEGLGHLALFWPQASSHAAGLVLHLWPRFTA